MHLDGHLLSLSQERGFNSACEPGLHAVQLKQPVKPYFESHYDHGIHGGIEQVVSDAGNALVWAVADGGARVKAYRAPSDVQPLLHGAAGCNRGKDNGMALQYTLNCSADDWGGFAGLHVWGTQLLAVKGNGMLCRWDIASLPPPQPKLFDGEWLGEGDDDDSPIGFDCTGAEPNSLAALQLPAPSSMVRQVSYVRAGLLTKTCMLYPAAAGAASTAEAVAGGCAPSSLVAAFASNVLVSYDLETQRAQQQFLGHLYEVTGLVSAPPSWQQPHLFGICALSGDVKIWDVRSRAGSAAVTLRGIVTAPLCDVVLAAAGGGAGGANSMGAGPLCFAGGEGQSVWCWDLRGGQAQVLYELSTGNMDVNSLAWYQPGNALLAACVRLNSYSSNCREDFLRLPRRLFEPPPPQQPQQQQQHVEEEEAEEGENGDTEDEDEGEDEDEAALLESLAGDGGAGGGGGSSGVDGRVWWPKQAAHDFRAYYNNTGSALLTYNFSSGAAQQVPKGADPCFEGDSEDW